MGKILATIICFLLSVSSAIAQVTPGTVSSKTLDGVGNKITSEAVGADRALHVVCLNGSCTGGGGGLTDVNITQILGVAPSATNWLPGRLTTGTTYYDARDRNWTLAFGTDSVTVNGITNPVTVSNAFLLDATFTGRFPVAYIDADAIANQTTTAIHGQNYMYNGATWDRMRGTIAGGLLVDVSDAFLLDATFTARINTLGQKTMANSTPVVLASDQTSIPTSATVTNAFLLDATFTGRFPAAYLDADGIANQTTTAIHGQGYMYNGATWDRIRGTIAGGLLVNISNASLSVTQGTSPWVVSGTVAATQSGVWSVGRTWALSAGTDSINLSQVGGAAISLGGNITAASIPVNIATDQVAVPVKYGTVSSANNDVVCRSGAVSFTALASNASRTWAAVWASPANTDDVFIKLGATATSADARFAPGQALNLTSGKIYTGVIDAIPASGTQAVCVMELN